MQASLSRQTSFQFTRSNQKNKTHKQIRTHFSLAYTTQRQQNNVNSTYIKYTPFTANYFTFCVRDSIVLSLSPSNLCFYLFSSFRRYLLTFTFAMNDPSNIISTFRLHHSNSHGIIVASWRNDSFFEMFSDEYFLFKFEMRNQFPAFCLSLIHI